MEKRGLGRGLAALIPEVKTEQGTEVREIPVEQVEANPYQPRTLFDPEKMAELVDSVKEHGILQPVLVRGVGHDRYQLVAGERRFRAAQKAGLTVVPAVVKDCTEREQLEIAVVENLQREDIGALEAARAYRRLIDEFQMTQETVAQRVGKSRSAVANVLRLLKLPEEVQESVERGEISEGHARALMMAEETSAILHAWQTTVRKQLSVRETENLARHSREAVIGSGPRSVPSVKSEALAKSSRYAAPAANRPDPNETDITDRLQEALGTKVSIRRSSGGSGRIEIEFYSAEELERLTDYLLNKENER